MPETEAVAQQPLGETRVRVRYAETDQMRVAYHANYLIWFEVGRAELIRQMGLNYKVMEQKEGCGIAVVQATLRYKSPARYDDELVVKTRITGVRGSVIWFSYTVWRDDTLLCEGATVHVVVDPEMKRAAMPERYAIAFREHHIPVEATDEED